jgi:hypothetical protein
MEASPPIETQSRMARLKRGPRTLKSAVERQIRDMLIVWPMRLFVFFLRLLYGFRAQGLENLPSKGPFILGLSEFSLFATVLSGWLAVMQIIKFHAVKPDAIMTYIQEELWSFGFMRTALDDKARGRYAPLEPHDAGRLALSLLDGYRTLQKQGIVIINPEGDMPWDGRPMPMGGAMVWLALHTGAPVVPALVSPGAYDIWPRWQAGPSARGTMKMVIGKPLYLCERPILHVTDAQMAEAAARVKSEWDNIRYGQEGLSGWMGPVLRNGRPLTEPLLLPSPPESLGGNAAAGHGTGHAQLPVTKRGMAQLLWRCPICHAEDALLHRRPRWRASRLACRACGTVWSIRRLPGHDFRLAVLAGPSEALGVDMALCQWYDTMKKDFRPEARTIAGLDLLPGEEAYLAADQVTLLPHRPNPLFDGWQEQEAPAAKPVGKTQLADWMSIGVGRLILTNQRAHWQGADRQLDFYWPRVASVHLWSINALGLHYGTARYRFTLDGEVGAKWLTYAGTLARQTAERTGCRVTVSAF